MVGEDRVLLGTDYPFPLGEVRILDTYPGKVILENDDLSDKTKVSVKEIRSLIMRYFEAKTIISDLFKNCI